MSKHAKHLPSAAVARWLGILDISWETWERRVGKEIAAPSFRFEHSQKKKISEAIRLLDRHSDPATKIQDAQKIIRKIKKFIENLGLPDASLLNPQRPWLPSDILLSLDFPDATEIFTQAMLHTMDESVAGLTVSERLGVYLRLLRSGECVLSEPRPEAQAVFLIKEVFDECGAPTKVTHTRHTRTEEGNEELSTFERFVFEHVMPSLGSDPAARKVFQRRLDEAERSLNL